MINLKISKFLQLIAASNLFLLLFAQFVFFQSVVNPILQIHGFELLSFDFVHLLLILATAFIVAGGSVVNHYFDMKIDAINDDDSRIVGLYITKKSTLILYQALTGIGIICGLLLAYLADSFTLSFIFIVLPGLIWFYASNYKRQFLLGNLIFSFLVSLFVFIVAISEVAFLELRYKALIFQTDIPSMLYKWLGGYAILIFFLALIFDIIKNLKDLAGARELEWRTVAVCWGVKATKILLYVLIFITTAFVLYTTIFYIHFPGNLALRYAIFGFALPFLFLGYSIFKASNSTDFRSSLIFVKIIFLLLIFSCFIFYYLCAKVFGISLLGLFVVQ